VFCADYAKAVQPEGAQVPVTRHLCVALIAGALLVGATSNPQAQTGLPYDIVYVRAPRHGDTVNTKWTEVFNPYRTEPGTDLMLLKADGTERVLVPGGPLGAVIDPCVSFDGEWVYYAHSPDVTLGFQYFFSGIPVKGFDIYKIHVASGQVVRLTFQESTPNTSVALPVLPYGVMNTGACPVSGGKVVFTSTRNQFRPVKDYTPLVSQLYVMDEDGANVTAIAPMTLGSALHPVQLMDGRLAFSSYEAQGIRDARLWGLWSIWPDGTEWGPLMSAFASSGNAFHFATQLTGGDIVLEDYYNLNNNGFGSFYRFAAAAPTPGFYPGKTSLNPALPYTLEGGQTHTYRIPFTPKTLVPITPFTTPFDQAAPPKNGVRVGKGTHPSAAPNGDLLVAWSFGPANDLNRPTPMPFYDSGLYMMPQGGPITSPTALVLIKNDPAYNEQWPRALVPYRAIYGIPQPYDFPWLPNAGTPYLPAGTPFGITGTSSLYKRESFPGLAGSTSWGGLDTMIPQTNASNNWWSQGSDAGKYPNSEIWGVRIVTLEPTTQGPRAWYNHAQERIRVLGEIPTRKEVLDPEGNPDTSFWAKIPADTPFTFQMINSRGQTLTMAQTWHQVRPGETRTSCGGCHAHSQVPLAFAGTAASHLPPTDLTEAQPVDVEFIRDIRPLLQRSCVSCHSGATAAASLDLGDLAMYPNTAPNHASPSLPGDYARLARDMGSRWGRKAWTPDRTWRFPQASRYMRRLQSRRSLLAWYVAGERLDGWTNAEWPSEATPGDPTTLSGGTASIYIADVDFVDTVGHGTLLTADEQRKVFTWIDLGAPFNMGGYFADELRPVLTISSPRPGLVACAVLAIEIGATDVGSGLNLASLQVDGAAVGPPVSVGPSQWAVPLLSPLTSGTYRLTVSIRDMAGNRTAQDVRFTVGKAGPPPPPPTAPSPPPGPI
jgi:hypothetical protein